MMDVIQANWLAFAVALLAALFVAWWLFGRATHVPERRERRPDVLDEGAAPAQRNQALIDAPSAALGAAGFGATGPGILAGIGEIAAVGAEEEALAASAPPAPAPSAPEAPSGDGDDLLLIKGVGPKLAALLRSLGVTRFAQIAGWSEADIDRIDAQLGTFKGRIRRDNWIEQAKLLATGDKAGFEAKFGKV
jgi:predicted flap endonuclease-1-like 5' DNA nuclease